ncbi:HD domain-containing phosphohydrolase [uncultured Deinococcus sp.]|uniref:HD domain-containing phosphohydrolase n=1 Tax=uncultured Deinococcus sp. TaxID=158789 RepID=UPI003749A928
MNVPPPYGGRWPFNWPGVLLTLGGYGLTFAVFVQMVRQMPGAVFQPTILGFGHLVVTLLLIVCTLWMIAFAYGFRIRVTVLQGIITGMLADLLFLRGVRALYGVAGAESLIDLGLMLVAAVSLILLVTGNNTENLRRERQERQAQETDVLTGQLNRRGVARRYSALPTDTALTVVMIDLNDLKGINDLGGHSLGDHHLRATAQALQGHLPPGAFLGRWGGDEFVAVLPGHGDVTAVFGPVQAQVPHPSGRTLPFAYGSAQVAASMPLDRALALADQQMYEDKAGAGRAAGDPEAGEGVADFPHFLLGLNSLPAILERGLSRAAILAGFEEWMYVERDMDRIFSRDAHNARLEAGVRISMARPGSMTSQVMTLGQSLWAADYERSPYAQTDWIERGLKSIVMTPVLEHGQVRGLVAFFNHRTWHSVTPKARQLLGAVATHLGHQLERDAVVERLESSVEATLTGLGTILEARDLETAGHTERVVSLALRLGKAAGLDADALHDLRLGAYLHDMGKLAIPDRVLLKPGPLDPAEWRLMQTHSREGALMAARLPALSPAVIELVRSHHERWDGQGYPDGLAGEGVPLLARIFALCDVYDALTHARPYKPAWTPGAARAELAAQAGRQFDPALTALFLRDVLGEGGDGGEDAPGPPAPGRSPSP